jgi:hypothetical protein
MSAIASPFLNELPTEAIETLDLSHSSVNRFRAAEVWRSGSAAAEPGWIDAGVLTRSSAPGEPALAMPGNGSRFVEGMLVRHDIYGPGRVTEVSGSGFLRKVKVRFSSHGERTFIAEKAKLEVVTSDK